MDFVKKGIKSVFSPTGLGMLLMLVAYDRVLRSTLNGLLAKVKLGA